MMSTQIIRSLARSPHFRGIPTDVLHGISMHAELVGVSAGQVIADRLQPAEAVWVIGEGRVDVRRLQGFQGERLEVAVSRLDPGMIFGHVGLLCEQPSTASWVAAGPGQLVRFERKQFDRLLADPRPAGAAFRRALILALGHQLQSVNRRLGEFVRNEEGEVASRRKLLQAALDSAARTRDEE